MSIVALLVSATMLFSCKDDIVRVDDVGIEESPNTSIDSLEVTYLFKGKVRRLIRTPEVRSFTIAEEQYDEFPQGGYIETYNDSLQLETTIFAKHAIHYVKPKEMWMVTDSVVVHNLINKRSVYTDTLYWDMGKREIYTNCKVKIVTPDMMIVGYEMRSDEQFRDYVLKNITNSELYYHKDEVQKKDSLPK